MSSALKIICVEFENLKHFEREKFRVDFTATDRVLRGSELYRISGNIFSQSAIGFIGVNAAGKTTALRLLKMALSVVIHNEDLNPLGLNAIVVSGTVMRVTFFYGGFYYQLESVIEVGKNSDGSDKFSYSEETLKKKRISAVTARKDLTDFADKFCEEIVIRSKLGEETAKYLDGSRSLVNPVVKNNNSCVMDNLLSNYANIASPLGEIPPEILAVFDENIESLAIEETTAKDNQAAWRLKFKDMDFGYSGSNTIILNFLISTGTISGQELIRKAILALQCGGYFIVDELEMHLNKEIIKVILNLFKSRVTNPRGACLIFSSHYPELLDSESLNRKDNIYIARNKNHILSVSKFSEEFSRNDVKKSDIILSNALGGTAPKYETIKRLRDYVCSTL